MAFYAAVCMALGAALLAALFYALACLRENARLKRLAALAQAARDDSAAALARAQAENARLSENFMESQKGLAAAGEREKALLERLETQGGEIQRVREKMQADFELLSNRIFEAARGKFSSANKEQLELILNPLKADLKSFEKKVDELNLSQERKNAGLEGHIKMLGELNTRLSEDARNLADALKGQNKTAGNWGEMVLSRLLDSCGLAEGREYVTQASFSDDGGARLMPDVIIRLPENKSIIIDSKVSLLDYERHFSAPDDSARKTALKDFAASVKAHVKGLSEKNYEAIEGLKNPDFVMMFIPIEPAFSLIAQRQPEIFDYAFSRKIILTTPSTLMAVLKTVEAVWRNEKQTKNTLEIARLGGVLYDGVKRFADSFAALGQRIGQLDAEYGKAMKALAHGKGNILTTAEKLRTRGVKVKGGIDERLLEDSGAEEEEELP